jgi:hypothetical protein
MAVSEEQFKALVEDLKTILAYGGCDAHFMLAVWCDCGAPLCVASNEPNADTIVDKVGEAVDMLTDPALILQHTETVGRC